MKHLTAHGTVPATVPRKLLIIGVGGRERETEEEEEEVNRWGNSALTSLGFYISDWTNKPGSGKGKSR